RDSRPFGYYLRDILGSDLFLDKGTGILLGIQFFLQLIKFFLGLLYLPVSQLRYLAIVAVSFRTFRFQFIIFNVLLCFLNIVHYDFFAFPLGEYFIAFFL